MRKSIFIVLLFFSLWQVFVQEIENPAGAQSQQNSVNSNDSQEHTDAEVLSQGFVFITAGPQLFYNAEGLSTSPSPISFAIGAGGNLPLFKNRISFAPYIKGWASYYIWINDKALPGALEKRTAYTLHALLDIPVMFLFPVQNSIFSVGLGISMLARYGFAETVVPEEEKPDIDKMNTYYWQNLRFLYPCLIIAWDYMLQNGTSFGFEVRAHYPISSIADQGSSPLQSALLSASVRFFFPRQWEQ